MFFCIKLIMLFFRFVLLSIYIGNTNQEDALMAESEDGK